MCCRQCAKHGMKFQACIQYAGANLLLTYCKEDDNLWRHYYSRDWNQEPPYGTTAAAVSSHHTITITAVENWRDLYVKQYCQSLGLHSSPSSLSLPSPSLGHTDIITSITNHYHHHRTYITIVAVTITYCHHHHYTITHEPSSHSPTTSIPSALSPHHVELMPVHCSPNQHRTVCWDLHHQKKLPSLHNKKDFSTVGAHTPGGVIHPELEI